MLYSIKNTDDLQKIDKLNSSQNQVEEIHLQDILGEQNFHENYKKSYRPLTDKMKDTSRDKTKTKTETSIKNNKALGNLNDKLLEILIDRGILSCYLLCSLSKITNPEHTSQFELIKDADSNRPNDLLINKTIPVTLYNNLLTFRDTNKEFVLQGDLLKMITNKNYNVDLAKLAERKKTYDFAKEMCFDEHALGNKKARGKFPIRLLKSPDIMASGISTKFLPENPIELCDRFKLSFQEKKADNISNLINEEVVVIAD